MKVRSVYNLEFPSNCVELCLAGYRFVRTSDYQEQLLRLQHIGESYSEFHLLHNAGAHAVTAQVYVPDEEEPAVLQWSGENNTALMDIMLLLSIFTGRDTFLGTPGDLEQEQARLIFRDPRIFLWGGTLRASIPYEEKKIDDDLGYNIGFEKELNRIYTLIRDQDWQSKYRGGYFLFLAKQAFHRQTLEASFVQCWTIWEHLFAVHKRGEMTEEQIRQVHAKKKVLFLLVEYALHGSDDETTQKRIKDLADIRNNLAHFGSLPEKDKVFDDAVLFIRLTEFMLAKILGLSPYDVFDTMKNLEEFLGRPVDEADARAIS